MDLFVFTIHSCTMLFAQTPTAVPADTEMAPPTGTIDLDAPIHPDDEDVDEIPDAAPDEEEGTPAGVYTLPFLFSPLMFAYECCSPREEAVVVALDGVFPRPCRAEGVMSPSFALAPLQLLLPSLFAPLLADRPRDAPARP